jgi:alkylation response protein AidB-like acyl-CoA dehydrogenase
MHSMVAAGAEFEPEMLVGIRLALAAIALGAGQRAVDHAARYATERIAFGRPIASCRPAL